MVPVTPRIVVSRPEEQYDARKEEPWKCVNYEIPTGPRPPGGARDWI